MIPPKMVGLFVFQKADDACPLDQNEWTTSIAGGNPASQVVNVP